MELKAIISMRSPREEIQIRLSTDSWSTVALKSSGAGGNEKDLGKKKTRRSGVWWPRSQMRKTYQGASDQLWCSRSSKMRSESHPLELVMWMSLRHLTKAVLVKW